MAATYALAFDGTPMTVDSGPFWPEHVPLGRFYWIARVRPAPNSHTGYILSDGYGGAHALLFGLLGGSSVRQAVTGNVWNGSRIVSFKGGACVVGRWCEVAVRWDGTAITVFVDGQTAGVTPFTGPRMAAGLSGGGGRALVGGSDHLNFAGQIAWIRGWEGTADPVGPPSLAYDFSVPATRIRDTSAGYRGSHHDGTLRGVARGIMKDCPSCPAPTFVRASP